MRKIIFFQGGYMAAKRSKLIDQFHETNIKKVSDIFKGIAIHVNGLTKPPIDVLKNLMAAHGGLFHAYQVPKTTHIIASNLANVKVSVNIEFITTKYINSLYHKLDNIRNRYYF